jgi:two-component system cell cycle sensor histidine kinase/response regulator CckA
LPIFGYWRELQPTFKVPKRFKLTVWFSLGNEWLIFTRLPPGKLIFVPTAGIAALDLAQAVREAIPLLRTLLPQKVHLKIDLAPSGPIIMADSAHIKQVLTHLVSNAGEAIDLNEGDITVAIQMMAAAEIQGLRFFPLDWEPKANCYACLSVVDTGCGVDEATRERLFDPFFSTKFIGRGLGLAVVLGLVRVQDGAINVESKLGRGSVFRVFFPLHTL